MLPFRALMLTTTVLAGLAIATGAFAQSSGGDCSSGNNNSNSTSSTSGGGQTGVFQGQGSYANAVSSFESTNNAASVNPRGYLGLYQMGGMALTQAGYVSPTNSNSNLQWNGTDGIYSTQQFLSNPQAQYNAWTKYEQGNWKLLQANGSTAYIGQTGPDGQPITASGLLMGSQFGAGAVKQYLTNGCTGSAVDGNGVCVGTMISKGNGYDVSNITGQSDTGSTGGGSSSGGGSGGGTSSNGTGNSSGNGGNCSSEQPTDMTSQTCNATMPIIEGINCGRFPSELQSFCNQYKPYLMTRDKCEEAEKWAEEQVKNGGQGSSQGVQQVQQPSDPQEGKESGGGGGPLIEPNVVNLGDDSEPGSSQSTPITPQPSLAVGGGPGGTPNNDVSGQPASGGPVPVGKIKPGQWAEACKKQTKYDGSSAWSYVLWCSQLKADPPRRQSSNAPGIAGNLGYSGPGNLGVSGNSSPMSGGGTVSNPVSASDPGGSSGGGGGSSGGEYNGTRPQNSTKNSNYTEPRQDPQCFQRLQSAGVQATFEGFNAASKIEPRTGRRCFVATSVSVRKWASASMGKAVPNMNCPLAEKVNDWIKGLGVGQVTDYGSYGCRPMNGNKGGGVHLSMHSYGDAYDLASMDGQKFAVWSRAPAIQQRAWQAACGKFDRVLGPGYYGGAYVHFHVEQGHGGSCNR
ncbi:hypothetical protein ACVIGB_000533 [Bradyrhizobium sp. USDA 4341]